MSAPHDRHKVRVVVDPSFGERLASLPAGEPVWVIDSAQNTPVAHRLWQERSGDDHLTGITTFEGSGLSPDDEAAGLLGTLEDHHGKYSTDAAFSQLEIIGCRPSDRLIAALGDHGFRPEESSSDTVVATRTNDI
jgi:hypothetical protein